MVRKNKSERKEPAVSPVVGVMLLIVITVVIAAVVAAVSSGIIDSAASQSDSPTVEFMGIYTGGYTVTAWNAYAANFTGKDAAGNAKDINFDSKLGGLLFKVTGSTPLDMTKLKVEMSSSTGGGGFCSLTSDDPVSMSYLPKSVGGTVNINQVKSGRMTPPSYMKGHRFAILGVDLDDPQFEEKAFAELAEPGTMFVMVPEYLGFTASLAIGIRKDDETGTAIQSGGMSADGNTLLTLSDTATGTIYVSHILIGDDYIMKV